MAKRVWTVIPTCEASRVLLPEWTPWIDEFLDELLTFPAGPHDGQVDSLTQALEYLRRGRAGWTMLRRTWPEQKKRRPKDGTRRRSLIC